MSLKTAEEDFERYKLEVEIHDDCTIQLVRDSLGGADAWQTWKRRRSLGQGAFGEVWQEGREDKHGDWHYRAVKICSQRKMQAAKVDYKRELSALAAFSKSECAGFFINLHGWWIDSGNVYLAMEFLRHGDLSNYATAELREMDVKEITDNVLRGLKVMHEEGFTHRDIKPQNILVVQKRPEFRKWWVKIADFGISKRILAESGSGLYSTVGTRAYCAPEILEISGHLTEYQETPTYSSKVDMWSLGCVLFNISSQGQRAFSESDLVRYCDGRLPFNPRKLPHCLGDSGESLLKALLNVEPEQRPTATEALQYHWFIAAGTTALNTFSTTQPKSQSLGRQNYNSFLDSTLSTSPPLHVDTLVEAPNFVSSVVTVVEIAGSIAKLCGEYIADVKDARSEIERLQQKATVLHDVLQKVVGANDPKNKMSSNSSTHVLAAVDRCSADLRALQEKLQAKTRHRTMSKFGMRALKWPLSKVAVNEEVKTMEGYWTVFNAALQLDHWTPSFVVGVDVGMTRTGVAWSGAPEWAPPRTIQNWPGVPGNGLADKVDTVLAYDKRSRDLAKWGFLADRYDPDFEIEELFKLYLDPDFGDGSPISPTLHQARMWYIDFLKCIYQFINRYFAETVPRWHMQHVEFVFSVPASWNNPIMVETTKHLIESAGFGNPQHRVNISLTEPEAASICVTRAQYKKNDVFLVCNAGGGTTNVSISKVITTELGQKNFELLSYVGDRPIGSMLIDFQVEEFVRERLMVVSQYLGADPGIVAHRMMMQGRFESFKCSYGEEQNPQRDLPLQIPGIPFGQDFPQAGIVDSKIYITRAHIQQVFDKQIEAMCRLIDDELWKLQRENAGEIVTYLILLGGLGSSAYVRKKLKQRYESGGGVHANAENIEIKTASKPHLAVVHGLVIDACSRRGFWDKTKLRGSRSARIHSSTWILPAGPSPSRSKA